MSEKLEGKIIKGIGGFYYVDTEQGVIECRARGKFRHEGITPLVGDFVTIEDAYVIDIAERKNSLIRPKVANVDQAIITFAAAKPKINFDILDRFLILTAEANVKAVICINKIEIDKAGTLDEIRKVYKSCGARIIAVSAQKEFGIDELKEALSGVTSVFAGPSGVGKTSIINLAVPEVNLKTGEVSRKISRGKHTTREAVLISIGGGGYVVDTPGFTSLSLEHLEAKKLHLFYNEFREFEKDCKYSACSHVKEQTEDCGIKSNVGENINEKRYSSYCRFYDELKQVEERKYD